MLWPLLALFFFQAAEEPKLATVEGAVTHAASKAAIRKAKVSLSPIGPGSSGTAETTDDGKYVLKDVRPGRYRITAEKTGYETTAYGARKAGDALGQVVRIDPGAAMTGIDIAMPKHGVIAGKVFDSSNEPVTSALVMALANTYYGHGRRGRLPRGTIPVISNDLGEYRIGQLPPGKYIVCAMPAGFFQPNPSKIIKPTVEDADAATCFPNVAQMADAAELEIRDGSEITAIDVRLNKTRTVSVQGRIAGVPPGAGVITILTLNTKGSGVTGLVTNPRAIVQTADGKFEFKNVQPGTYILHSMPTGLGNLPFVVKTEVEIGEKPITNLEVPASVPFEIKGRVTAEAGGPELKLPSLRVILTPADEITSSLSMANPTASGELTVGNVVPGRHRVTISGLPSEYYVRELRSGNQAAPGDEVEISDASTTLTVALAPGRGEMNGVVRNEKGDPVPGATVALIPKPRRPFRQRTARTDQNGVFTLSNIPPGEFSLVSFDSIESGALEDDEFLKPFAAKMKTVKLEDQRPQNHDLSVLRVAER